MNLDRTALCFPVGHRGMETKVLFYCLLCGLEQAEKYLSHQHLCSIHNLAEPSPTIILALTTNILKSLLTLDLFLMALIVFPLSPAHHFKTY